MLLYHQRVTGRLECHHLLSNSYLYECAWFRASVPRSFKPEIIKVRTRRLSRGSESQMSQMEIVCSVSLPDVRSDRHVRKQNSIKHFTIPVRRILLVISRTDHTACNCSANTCDRLQCPSSKPSFTRGCGCTLHCIPYPEDPKQSSFLLQDHISNRGTKMSQPREKAITHQKLTVTTPLHVYCTLLVWLDHGHAGIQSFEWRLDTRGVLLDCAIAVSHSRSWYRESQATQGHG